MRKPLIAGNWKMYKTIDEAVQMVEELKALIADVEESDIVICPTFTALAKVADAVKGSKIDIGAQNMYWEEEGAFTGEISPKMVKDSGCKYVILGHSERRQYFEETDIAVSKKAKAAFANGLTPIVCVGELLEEREAGKTEQVLKNQVEGSLAGLTKAEAEKLVIAYEPVWAIGTGKTASKEDAQHGCAFIRQVVAELFGEEVAQVVRIQYGGSVKPQNIKELMEQADIDGALVGGASLEADSFTQIVKY